MKIEIAACGGIIGIRRKELCLTCYQNKKKGCACCGGKGYHYKQAEWERDFGRLSPLPA